MGIAGVPLATNQQINAAVFNGRVVPKYGFYYLKAQAENITAQANNAVVSIISKSRFSDVSFPLPPLVEQRRIAAILDKADAIRRKHEQALALADDFLRSTFLHMFGDPSSNSNNWEIVPLSELVRKGDRINYGVVQPGTNILDGIPIVRVGDFRNGRIDASSLKKIDPNIERDYRRSRLVGDEILLSCVGSIGLVALADESLRGMNIVRAVARIPLKESVVREYVAFYFETNVAQQRFRRETRTVSQPTLNISLIAETAIPLPPLTLQQEFKHIVDLAGRTKAELEETKSSSDQLFASLAQRAFRGEL
jgi:Restriction endonuclease S subunits